MPPYKKDSGSTKRWSKTKTHKKRKSASGRRKHADTHSYRTWPRSSQSSSYDYEYHPSTTVLQVLGRAESEPFIKMPLTVQVVRLGPYVPKGTAKVRCRCVLGDSMALIRGFCFQQPTFRAGDTLTLRNYSYEDGYVIIHSATELSRAGYGMQVPRHLLGMADSYMASGVQPPRRISELRADTRVTFYARITQVDEIQLSNHGAPVRNIHCEDSSGQIVLAMWRYCSAVEFKVGQTIFVRDGRAKSSTYYDMVSVSINHPDEVQLIKVEH